VFRRRLGIVDRGCSMRAMSIHFRGTSLDDLVASGFCQGLGGIEE